jgi:hypothetical protein
MIYFYNVDLARSLKPAVFERASLQAHHSWLSRSIVYIHPSDTAHVIAFVQGQRAC